MSDTSFESYYHGDSKNVNLKFLSAWVVEIIKVRKSSLVQNSSDGSSGADVRNRVRGIPKPKPKQP